MIQNDIDAVLYSGIPHGQSLQKLRTIIQLSAFEACSDFDDTITTYTSLFYSKIKLQKIFHLPSFDPKIQLNQKWLKKCSQLNIYRIIIISRWFHESLRDFLVQNKDLFRKNNIEIIGFIGSTDTWRLSIEDKLRIIPHDAYYLTDIFEERSAKRIPDIRSIIVDTGGVLKYTTIIFIKYFALALFFFKQVWKAWYRLFPK